MLKEIVTTKEYDANGKLVKETTTEKHYCNDNVYPCYPVYPVYPVTPIYYYPTYQTYPLVTCADPNKVYTITVTY